jgi:hypothetical protein
VAKFDEQIKDPLLGILSHMSTENGCADHVPLVFVRISSYFEWIVRVKDYLTAANVKVSFPLAFNLVLELPETASERYGPATTFEVLVPRSLHLVEFELEWIGFNGDDYYGNPVIQIDLEGAKVSTELFPVGYKQKKVTRKATKKGWTLSFSLLL